MEDNMKDIFFSLGIILTFIIGVWNIINNYRASRRTAFINTVTAERVKWIEKLRENISEFCGLTYTWSFSKMGGTPRGNEFVEKIDKLRHVIRLQLNPDGELDKKIEELIARVPDLTHETQKDQLNTALDSLVTTTKELLKAEWEKVKAESKRGDLQENEHCLAPILEKMNDWCLRHITKRQKSA
jgi:hypothetical protein